MNQPIEALLDEVDARLKQWMAGEIPNSQYPASALDVERLSRELRQRIEREQELEKSLKLYVELKRGQETKANQLYDACERLTAENAALRQQLEQTAAVGASK